MTRLIIAALTACVVAAGTGWAQSFPATVSHVYGDTEISAAPQRIVSLGRNDQDFLYALGVAPIAVREWWGGAPYATWPWAEQQRAALQAEPVVIHSAETNIEWIAAQQPDLILAIYEDVSRAQYDGLSRIAPVVLRPAGHAAFRTPWQDQLRQTALAVTGSEAAANGIIADLEAKAQAIRSAYPVLEGKTASLADYRNGQVTLWASDHAPTRFLTSLGLVFPDALEAKANAAGWIYVSPENMAQIDLDVLIWPNGHRDALADLAVYRQLRLHREGRAIFLPGSTDTLAAALWFQTPLSLSYAMDNLAPLLELALDGDPDTAGEIPD